MLFRLALSFPPDSGFVLVARRPAGRIPPPRLHRAPLVPPTPALWLARTVAARSVRGGDDGGARAGRVRPHPAVHPAVYLRPRRHRPGRGGVLVRPGGRRGPALRRD